ncbi:MAG: DapH/DapD/GlmU-related protein [Planctomycetota bacterium]
MFDNIKADLRHGLLVNHKGLSRWKACAAQFFHPGTQAVLVYRLGRWASQLRIPIVRHLLLAVYYPLKYGVRVFTGVNIPTSAEIGGGLVIHTWSGVYIPACRIGRNAYFQHGVVVGYGCLGIGDDVYFGPGCKVIRPVRIGDRARIGANAVVIEDVPDDCTVAGIPARIVKGPGIERQPGAVEEENAADGPL